MLLTNFDNFNGDDYYDYYVFYALLRHERFADLCAINVHMLFYD